ncbi:hypothetical protein [Spirochaeta isovalerica]|uniref:Uncharacterized protein n=1 Tax=Spirochaeta isovalerica TaxID=150 RepID=A0A841RBB6_9SPIO|nr:hypothetical protein [Spirochaeta isovalerica]MBB6480651.1 hypothetical protein [Spirochaeta isovalerica]
MKELFLKSVLFILGISVLSVVLYSQDRDEYSIADQRTFNEYRQAIERTADMVYDQSAIELASRYGLDIVDVTWEDTGRYYNSSVGPNISDMTIQVGLQDRDNRDFFEVTAMPVIRFPNNDDLSTDLDPRDFTLLTGNEKGEDLKRISLYDFLESPGDFLSDPDSWPGLSNSLLAPRDSKVLVSAQACFLPIPSGGKAIFNPVLFNYQSYEKNPAVLTVLATREGTSVTIIDNVRDTYDGGFFRGQRLFFNRNGEKASLTGQRQSEFFRENNSGQSGTSSAEAGRESGLNMVLLIQIPLKQKPQRRGFFGGWMEESAMESAVPMAMEKSSDVENAVIGSGPVEGPFIEIDGLKIKRDPDFPVRVTVQFYKATSNGIVSERDIDEIAHQIRKVYSQGDYVSSLVTGGGAGRVTEYSGLKVQPPFWWRDFWRRFEKNRGMDREDAIIRLLELLGEDYRDREVSELYLRDLLSDII